MRLSFKTRPQFSEWQPILDFWKEAERIDLYDAGWTFDHLDP
ncbi:LLM class F420-dependent oxidoreductase, partial [bacterium]|nr:LLM class F420-dependent oxidoreductase [bacterium]